MITLQIDISEFQAVNHVGIKFDGHGVSAEKGSTAIELLVSEIFRIRTDDMNKFLGLNGMANGRDELISQLCSTIIVSGDKNLNRLTMEIIADSAKKQIMNNLKEIFQRDQNEGVSDSKEDGELPSGNGN